MAAAGAGAHEAIFDQDRNDCDRILTFGVAVETGLKAVTIARQVAEQLGRQERALGPDTVVILQRGVVDARRVVNKTESMTETAILGLQDPAAEATSMQEWDAVDSRIWDPFSYLVTKILEKALQGRTSDELSLLKYMSRMGWAASGFAGSSWPIGPPR